jgi:uncharacterized protein
MHSTPPAFALPPSPLRRPGAARARALAAPRRAPPQRAARMSLDPAELADVPVERARAQKRPLDELVDFPCVFTFKVVGLNEGEFLDDICVAVADALNTATRHLKTSFRDRGKYRSITLRAPVSSADQIYDVYAAVGKDARVKFKF